MARRRPSRSVSPWVPLAKKLARWAMTHASRRKTLPIPTRNAAFWAAVALVGAFALLLSIAIWLVATHLRGEGSKTSVPEPPDGFLACSWNVENFYDDRDDPRNADPDEDRFGQDPQAFEAKVAILADSLLLQNGGRGPDLLVMIEVESRRCVEQLRDVLNDRLSADAQYTGIVQRDNRTGRKFAPAVLTRLGVRDDLTRDGDSFGGRRVLEAHLEAEGVPLVVLASHWTSRVRGETEDKRLRYSQDIYGEFLRLQRHNPAVDLLICGDFNDEPDDPSLKKGLHAVDDPSLVRGDDRQPNLFDLVARRDPRREGTYLHNGRWSFLDHILASPGLLDSEGWKILPDTLATANNTSLRLGREGAPRKFGGAKNFNRRGPSDHFALTVRLKLLRPSEPAPAPAPVAMLRPSGR